MERALCSMGIGLEALASEESLVPRVQACQFLEMVARREGIDRFGLEVGQRTSVRDMGMFGACLSRSFTLHDLLRKLLRLMPMVDSGCRVWIEPAESSNHIKLCYRMHDPTGRPDASAFALLGLIDAVRMATGSSWRPKRIWLEKAAGGELEHFEALSEAAADRDVNYAAFEVPRDRLSASVLARKPSGRNNFDEELAATAPPENLPGTVAQVIRASFGAVTPTIRQVSEMANMSVRTLQRGLRAEGVSYGDLVERLRFEAAVSLIRQSNTPIAEIARHLGYAEAAPFSVAFRRWTGQAPSHYRKTFKE